MNAPVNPITAREHEFVEHLAATLRDQGFRVRTEVSNMGQSVDLVATRGRWVTVIEAKLADWKRALSQCRTHEHIADYICIALGTASVPHGLIEAVAGLGYGIIHYNRTIKEFEWVVQPRLNRAVWGPQRKYWAGKIRKIPNAN